MAGEVCRRHTIQGNYHETGRPGCTAVGGWKELEEAVKRNEVWKVGDLYQWSEYQEHELEGRRGSMQASGIRKLGLQQFNEINKQMANNDSNLDIPGSERTAWDNTALADPRPVPEKITANLAKDQQACDKAITDGKDILEQLRGHMTPFSDTDYAIFDCLCSLDGLA